MSHHAKRPKLTKKKTLIISAGTGGTVSRWRNPKNKSLSLSNDIQTWIEFAKLAESGKLNSIFIADHYTAYDTYQGPNKWELPFKHGVSVPRIDPTTVITAITSHTESISIAVTASTISDHPYLFARRLSSLDTFSNGRVGWNIVSSYLQSTGRQLLNGEDLIEHDKRYDRTAEYVEVVVKLLESSWRRDALVQEGENFIDPERVRQIDHVGEFFKVAGPSIFQPSAQGIPVLMQAGTSSKGKILAAELAEIVFIDLGNIEKLKKNIKDIRRVASEVYGRDPSDIKFVVPVDPIIGKTEEEAIAKWEETLKYKTDEFTLVQLSGMMGMDLSDYRENEEIKPKSKTNASRGTAEATLSKDESKNITKGELLGWSSIRSRFVGTAVSVTDYIEELVEETDIDGFIFGLGAVYPSGLEAIVELLIPELQKRGLFWDDYRAKNSSFRENLYESNSNGPFLPESHPYSKFQWKEGVTKTAFEEQLQEAQSFLIKARTKAESIISGN